MYVRKLHVSRNRWIILLVELGETKMHHLGCNTFSQKKWLFFDILEYKAIFSHKYLVNMIRIFNEIQCHSSAAKTKRSGNA